MVELSDTQVDKLGKRLAAGPASRDDLVLLEELRATRSRAMDEAADVVRRLGLTATSRPKTTGTIVEKLRRDHGRLSTMEDIAGLRLDPVASRTEQDLIVARLVSAFPTCKARDRRCQRRRTFDPP